MGVDERTARGQIAVVVQDPLPLVRDSMRLLLERHGIAVVDSVATIAAAEDAVVRRQQAGESVDAVLLAVDAPLAPTELKRVRSLVSRRAVSRVLGHTRAISPERQTTAARAGCEGVIDLRDGIAATVLALVERGPDGDAADGPGEDGQASGGPHVSDREVSVLRLLAAGHTSREVGTALGLSAKTVENHKQRIFAKLGVQNKAHAIAVANQLGLLERTAAGRSRT